MMSQQLLEEEADLSKHASQRMNFAHGVEKLSEVFTRFGALVVEQGETIRIIDRDIEEASMEVEEGHRHVGKTYAITKGNRSVIIKVFATILIFAVVLTRL
mmetsp:Transcript_29837/g.79681  ORF Transcript_29837/g.79681 Transcript_29837/m.79681 type:complete len:101 (-) Transcript_29837:7-309(-)